MSQHQEHNTTPPTSPKGDAYWLDRKNELEIFLKETQKSSPDIQRQTLIEISSDLTKESWNASFEDNIHYRQMIRDVRQELFDLNTLYPESKKDKAVNLATTFTRAAINTTSSAANATYKVGKPIAVRAAQLAWAGAAWTGKKLWDIARGEGEKIIDSIGYEIDEMTDEIKRGVRNTIADIRDDIAHTYHENEPKIFATAGMASIVGVGALVWNLTHHNLDAAPEGRIQLAINDQPESVQTILNEEWNPKIPGLIDNNKIADAGSNTTQPNKKHKNRSHRKSMGIDWSKVNMDNITLVANVAANKGVSPHYAATITFIESKGQANAQHRDSKASGLCQFIPSTARHMGLIPGKDASHPRSVFNKEANANACTEFTKLNQIPLEKALGRIPTDAELYLAHQQGAAGAIKLLNNPNAKASDLVGTKAIVQNGGHTNMTARDFVNKWARDYMRVASLFEVREVK